MSDRGRSWHYRTLGRSTDITCVVWRQAEPLLRPGVNEVRDQHVSLDEGHGYCLDGSLVHGPSQVVMQANSHWQDQVALLDARARSSYQPPTGSRHEVRLIYVSVAVTDAFINIGICTARC
jgi:hypothetical protein